MGYKLEFEHGLELPVILPMIDADYGTKEVAAVAARDARYKSEPDKSAEDC